MHIPLYIIRIIKISEIKKIHTLQVHNISKAVPEQQNDYLEIRFPNKYKWDLHKWTSCKT